MALLLNKIDKIDTNYIKKNTSKVIVTETTIYDLISKKNKKRYAAFNIFFSNKRLKPIVVVRAVRSHNIA